MSTVDLKGKSSTWDPECVFPTSNAITFSMDTWVLGAFTQAFHWRLPEWWFQSCSGAAVSSIHTPGTTWHPSQCAQPRWMRASRLCLLMIISHNTPSLGGRLKVREKHSPLLYTMINFFNSPWEISVMYNRYQSMVFRHLYFLYKCSYTVTICGISLRFLLSRSVMSMKRRIVHSLLLLFHRLEIQT